ncbi:hypothetical protein [Halostella sp. PRR32]|uniref:DUF5789 family protein n=1 Tax=Halostella sp. PRR32 TaxID=3098147 RepID=UPI002B1DB137|nr:hypothetical protein [Halostella sp. PRR32]
MADNKKGRDKQAHDAERRQRERDIASELERGDETEPPIEAETVDDIERELGSIEFPATGTEVVAMVGDREIESDDRAYTVEELVPDSDEESFDSPGSVRMRIQRPTVAAAVKQVVEASDTLQNADLSGSQRDAYEKTFRELKAIDADDDDEGIQAISDWVVGQIRDKEALPDSRALRRQAAKYCRENGYQIRDDEWLGV